MNPIPILKKEHAEIRDILLAIESLIGNSPSPKKMQILLDKLYGMWHEHEEREEKSLEWFEKNNQRFPFKKVLMEEHREVRGHWKVLKNSLKANEELIDVALDTDGRMLIEKLRKHIDFEDGIFDKALQSASIELAEKT